MLQRSITRSIWSLARLGIPCQTSQARCLSGASTSDDLQEFRESVREFAQAAIAPHAEAVDKANSFPTGVNLWREMGDFGLLAITAPPEYGGLGLGYQEHTIAMEVGQQLADDNFLPQSYRIVCICHTELTASSRLVLWPADSVARANFCAVVIVHQDSMTPRAIKLPAACLASQSAGRRQHHLRVRAALTCS
jgi:hypothetical protein